MNLASIALKLYAPKAWAFEESTKNPRKAQETVLFNYLERNKNTQYGKKYLFSSIKTIDDYQRHVPLADCETMRGWVDRLARGEKNILTSDEPIFFGATSGTTSIPKLIPTTRFSEKINSELIDIWSYYI
nr:GH3 auxin-responsive promoter family protein [Candidatus Omnitrophota bacterium]